MFKNTFYILHSFFRSTQEVLHWREGLGESDERVRERDRQTEKEREGAVVLCASVLTASAIRHINLLVKVNSDERPMGTQKSTSVPLSDISISTFKKPIGFISFTVIFSTSPIDTLHSTKPAVHVVDTCIMQVSLAFTAGITHYDILRSLIRLL